MGKHFILFVKFSKLVKFQLYLILLGLIFMAPPLWAEGGIGALGRIRPGGTGDGMIRMGGPPDAVISEFLVRENQWVRKGTPLVLFQHRAMLETQVALAELAVSDAGEIGAQKIVRKEVQIETAEHLAVHSAGLKRLALDAAKEEYAYLQARSDKLASMGALVTQKEAEAMQYRLRLAKIKRDQAAQELEVDLRSHTTRMKNERLALQHLRLQRDLNLKRTKQELKAAMQRLNQAILRAPVDGTILQIIQKVGEKASPDKLLLMAELDQIYVMADIYENDVLKVQPGMKVEISSNALPIPLNGVIESIRRTVNPRSKTTTARIRLEDSRTASRLINLEVNVSINPQGEAFP